MDCKGREDRDRSLNTARNVEGDFEMSTLVIYFSQTGTTKAAVEKIASCIYHKWLDKASEASSMGYRIRTPSDFNQAYEGRHTS